MEVPVYLFTGFLEAGKTSFIKETMSDPNFNDEKKQYLVITCEEGEVEFEDGEFPDNVHFSSFDDVQLLTSDRLNAMAKRAGADIVVVEYNGMWNVDAFYNALPQNWMVYQEIMIADSSTIISYNANMRQLVVDKLTSCEMVVFNRFKPEYDKMALHKIVRGISKRANICYEDLEGEIEFDDIEDPLPFDINADVIVIEDKDYAYFYRDLTENLEEYIGKTVHFKGIAAADARLPEKNIVLGRHIMTCCEDDIAYSGVACVLPEKLDVKTRDWLEITAKIEFKKHYVYRGKGPVLMVSEVKRCDPIEQALAVFY